MRAGRLIYPVTAAIISLFTMVTLIWSQFYPYVMENFGITDVAPVALSSSISFAFALVFQIISGFITDKKGPKLSLAIAGFAMLAGMLLVSMTFSYDSWNSGRLFWYAGSAVIGTGGGMYIGAFPVVLGRWFPESPGKAFGIAIFGQNLSPLILAPLAAYLIKNAGLQNTFILLGLLIFAVIYSIGVALWKVPAKVGSADLILTQDLTLSQALRDRRFWVMFAAMYSVAFGWFLILLNIATIIVEGLVESAGLNSDYVLSIFVPAFMAVTAIANAVGGFFWGMLTDRIGGPFNTLPVNYATAAAIILVLMAVYTNPIPLIAAGILLYFAFGGQPTVHFSAVPTFFGKEAIGRITTVLNTSVFTAAIFGPYVGAYLKDCTGTYITALAVSAALHFFAVFVILVGRRYSGGDGSVQIRKPEGV